MGSLKVRHDWATSLSLFTCMHWRRKWQPTPVFLPGESQGQGSLVGCCLWGRRVRHDWSDLAAASRIVREGISVVSATALGVPCYSSPSRLTQVLWRTNGIIHGCSEKRWRRMFTFYPTHLYLNSYFLKNVCLCAASDLSFSILDPLWHTGSLLSCTVFL